MTHILLTGAGFSRNWGGMLRYAAGHADGAAGLVGAALTSVTASSISEQRLG